MVFTVNITYSRNSHMLNSKKKKKPNHLTYIIRLYGPLEKNRYRLICKIIDALKFLYTSKVKVNIVFCSSSKQVFFIALALQYLYK